MKLGDEYEIFTKLVCEAFSRYKELTKKVEVKKVMIGKKTGAKHEVDVYWEYELEGKINKVAIECKDHKTRISKGLVQEFVTKVDDIGDVEGVMVTKIVFQKGAKQVAKGYKIKLLVVKELEVSDFEDLDMPPLELNLSMYVCKAVERRFVMCEEWLKASNISTDESLQIGNREIAKMRNNNTGETLSMHDFEIKYMIPHNICQPIDGEDNKYLVNNIKLDNHSIISDSGQEYPVKATYYIQIWEEISNTLHVDVQNLVDSIVRQVTNEQVVFMHKKNQHNEIFIVHDGDNFNFTSSHKFNITTSNMEITHIGLSDVDAEQH